MTWHSSKKNKRKREKTCCAFVNSPFHVPTPGFSFSPPCITTSNRGSEANSHPLYPQGGGWLSQSAHLLCCFYYDSHLSPAPVAHLSSPDSQNMRCHDTRFYRKKVVRYLFPSSCRRVYMYRCRLQWGYWCAGGGHDPGGTVESLWKGMCMCGCS